MNQETFIRTASAAMDLHLVAISRPQWEEAEETLVRVKLPQEVQDLAKKLSDTLDDQNQSDVESAIVNTLILRGLRDTAVRLKSEISGLREALNTLRQENQEGR